jgi:hypothetical protein
VQWWPRASGPLRNENLRAAYEGYPRFAYGGFSFLLVDPWPEYWAANWYSADDLYIDYDAGYYLYDRRYPNVRIAITVALELARNWPCEVIRPDTVKDPFSRRVSKQGVAAIEPGFDGLHEEEIRDSEKRNRPQQRHRQRSKPQQASERRVRQRRGHCDHGQHAD